ncbi:MAG: hypothetical protein NXI10_02310 [bacterium]|nr:hypothetical protein [bacterium]
MRSILLITLLVFFVDSAFAQSKYDSLQQSKKELRELAFAHTGMGITTTFPRFGDAIQNEEPWRAFNINYGYFDLNVGFCRANFISSAVSQDAQPGGFDITVEGFNPYETRYGRWWSFGSQVPISDWGLGKAKSYARTWRLMPSIGLHFGSYKYWSVYGGKKEREDDFNYISITPGVRLQAPFVTADFNIDFCGGITDNPHLKKWGITGIIAPRFTLRADAMLTLFNPKASYFDYTNVHVTSSHTSTETYREGNFIYKRTTTYYTATTSTGRAAFMDIGPFVGIGPKITFQPPHFEKHSTPTRLYGLVTHMRVGPMSLGLNFEGGRLGHASQVESNVTAEDKYWKYKFVDRASTYGKGSMGVFQSYLDIGVELNSLLLALGGMYVNERGSGTPFFAASVGYSLGGYAVFNQQFTYEGAESQYQNLDPEENTNFNNPMLSKGGYLGGWYFALDIGALQFRYQSFRYRRAPLASTHVWSIAYRFPFLMN